MNNTLLIIGYVWPEPASSAAGSRMLELIQLFLRQQWRVIFASAAALSEHRTNLADIGVEEKSILLNDSSFNDFVAQLQPQAVLFDRFFSEEQFGWRVTQACPQAIRLLDTEDLHSLRYVRQQLLKQQQVGLRTEKEKHSLPPVAASAPELYAAMSATDMAPREIAAIFRCDLTLMISPFEIDLLQKYFQVPAQLLCYSPFFTVAASAIERLPSFDAREHFVAIGNFRHEPNWDAVLYLKHCLWPLIHAALPHAQLHVYGAYPPPKATQLHNPKQGFHIKGWAEDALQVMQSARVCLAPVRFGAGIKGKLMDAMRMATPSVTTTIGAEGMRGDYPWGGFIANDAQAFVQAAVALYQQQDLWQQSQQLSRQVLHGYFGGVDHAQVLWARFEYLAENLHQERQQNFIGTMLQHHTLKSTQYMSQWIEAKNKKLPTMDD